MVLAIINNSGSYDLSALTPFTQHDKHFVRGNSHTRYRCQDFECRRILLKYCYVLGTQSWSYM